MAGEIHEIDKRGEEYLTLLGFGEIIDQPVRVQVKKDPPEFLTVPAKDFLRFCGQHAIPAFEAFKALDPSTKEYVDAEHALTALVTAFVKPPETK